MDDALLEMAKRLERQLVPVELGRGKDSDAFMVANGDLEARPEYQM
jgi:hypothetical protein